MLKIVCVSLFAVLALATGVAFGSRPVPVQATHHVQVEQDTPVVLGEVGSVRLTPRIVRHAAPQHTRVVVDAPRIFVCGPMHENAIGGHNRDCEWK